MKGNAIIITDGDLEDIHAKTAHGLIRTSNRFDIKAIIAEKQAGKDAGEVLDGRNRGIPIHASITSFVQDSDEAAKFCVVGIATHGGVITPTVLARMKEALENGMSIICGLHEFAGDIPELARLAKEKGLEIKDVRRPKPKSEMKFWSGEIRQVTSVKIAVLGTDCALGKRTTARFLKEEMTRRGHTSEMIYTGQTGWMQGSDYGFVFDSTFNDFVSGEIESSMVKCFKEVNPDFMFIEGQSALRNPMGPCGSEFIISAMPDGIILQHSPVRKIFDGAEAYGDAYTIPSIENEMKLIELLGGKVLAVTLNTLNMPEKDAREFAEANSNGLGIPVILPKEDGVKELVPLLEELMHKP